MQEFLNYMFRNSHSSKFRNSLPFDMWNSVAQNDLILHHLESLWECRPCLEASEPAHWITGAGGVAVVGWWRPIGPHVFYVLCTRPTLSLPCHVFSIFHRAPSKTMFSIPMRQISLWLNFDCQLQSCTHVGSRCPRQSWACKKSASQRVRVCATLPICQTSILTNLSGGSSDILICQTITRR